MTQQIRGTVSDGCLQHLDVSVTTAANFIRPSYKRKLPPVCLVCCRDACSRLTRSHSWLCVCGGTDRARGQLEERYTQQEVFDYGLVCLPQHFICMHWMITFRAPFFRKRANMLVRARWVDTLDKQFYPVKHKEVVREPGLISAPERDLIIFSVWGNVFITW